MKLSDVGLKYPELKPILSKFDGIKNLYPTQSDAIRMGALETSFLLASGTASGKTLVANLAAARTVLSGKKVLYLAPLRSLAFEKFSEFKKLPFRTAISIGEMDSSDPWLQKFDIIVATYEKAESLIRHRPDWLKQIGLVVFDEAHEMMRKPLIETLTIKLKWAQRLILSATIGNVSEIADWLGFKYLESDFRPVPLKEGVIKGSELVWTDEVTKLQSNLQGIEGLIEDGLKKQHQTLIFANTRREAEATAEKATRLIEGSVDVRSEKLEIIANEIEGALDYPTRQCKKLAAIVRRGSAFHHAGLVNEQRILVEKAFKTGLIPVLASTVTLVAGINMPSRRVIVKSPHFRGEPWPVSLYKQAAGRSGRPGYDKEGESIILHKRPDFALEYYINGQVENITSPLAYEPTLRREIIGLFASGFAMSKKDVKDFMGKTFYAYHHGNPDRIIEISMRVVDKLISWDMLSSQNSKGDFLAPTKLGKRVAELYIDPQTAVTWINAFEASSPLGYIHLIGMGDEMYLPGLKNSEKEELMYSYASRGEELIYPKPAPWDLEFEKYMKALKLSMIIEEWIEEKTEDSILNRFGIAPGDLRNYIRNTEWLAYALNEVIGVTKGKRNDLLKLSKRVRHGVRSELVELADLPGIGRVKSRRLYKKGVTISNIRKKSDALLTEVIGKSATRRLREKLKKS
ncbi:MAG: DEAD/DEAH box helicase [Candidatus Altiarchaeota archaeon]|nr:DEAD/DEAH box helicase [Candidatus Altiarchaeota archaeon]